jgi:hypothetical protein
VRDIDNFDIDRRRVEKIEAPAAQHTLPGAVLLL